MIVHHFIFVLFIVVNPKVIPILIIQMFLKLCGKLIKTHLQILLIKERVRCCVGIGVVRASGDVCGAGDDGHYLHVEEGGVGEVVQARHCLDVLGYGGADVGVWGLLVGHVFFLLLVIRGEMVKERKQKAGEGGEGRVVTVTGSAILSRADVPE